MSSSLSMRVRVLFLTVHMIHDYRAHGAGAFLRSSISLGYGKPYGEVVLVRRFFIPNFFGTKDPRPAPRTWTGKPNCSSTLRSDSISKPSDQGHRPPISCCRFAVWARGIGWESTLSAIRSGLWPSCCCVAPTRLCVEPSGEVEPHQRVPKL
jgi:hypothetical protein